MLAVDLQENPATVAKFMQDNKFSFPALIDKGEVSIKYRVSSIPTTFFIDKYGGIIGSAMGERDWASEEAFGLIEALLKSKSSKEK